MHWPLGSKFWTSYSLMLALTLVLSKASCVVSSSSWSLTTSWRWRTGSRTHPYLTPRLQYNPPYLVHFIDGCGVHPDRAASPYCALEEGSLILLPIGLPPTAGFVTKGLFIFLTKNCEAKWVLKVANRWYMPSLSILTCKPAYGRQHIRVQAFSWHQG